MKFRDLFDKETWLPDWDYIFSIREFKAMEMCEQSKIWHKEGVCSIHTKKVCDNMLHLLSERDNITPSDNEYYIMMISAAICHDLGKPSTTKYDETKGDYTTKCHGIVGSRIARNLFYDENFELREKICYMVRHHMDLHHIFDKEEYSTRKMIQLSHGRVTVKDMLYLSLCDSLGSVNDFEDDKFMIKKEEDIKSLADNLNCYTEPYKFSNEFEKIRFFHSREQLKSENSITIPENYGEFKVYVMIGISGSGKSTYAKEHFGELPILSRDDIRTEMGLVGEKPQGTKEQEDKVTEIFNNRMIEYCEKEQSFVIDNTNLRKKYRDSYTEMMMKYIPYITYVYVESPSLAENKNRRKGMIPKKVIDHMWQWFDFPELTECNEFICDIQH